VTFRELNPDNNVRAKRALSPEYRHGPANATAGNTRGLAPADRTRGRVDERARVPLADPLRRVGDAVAHYRAHGDARLLTAIALELHATSRSPFVKWATDYLGIRWHEQTNSFRKARDRDARADAALAALPRLYVPEPIDTGAPPELRRRLEAALRHARQHGDTTLVTRLLDATRAERVRARAVIWLSNFGRVGSHNGSARFTLDRSISDADFRRALEQSWIDPVQSPRPQTARAGTTERCCVCGHPALPGELTCYHHQSG
jgi:hypothetical protein